MSILNSIVVGKARNKAGSAVFYTRMGVPCFREKAVLSKNRSYSAAQLAQQKVYKFIKTNLDAFGLMPIVNVLFDQKASSGKGQTKYNLFYKAFLPHIQAQRDEIALLDDSEMKSASMFLRQPSGFNDRIIEGVLGASGATLTSATSGNATLTMDALAVQGLLEKANAKLSASDTLFTIDNIFVGSIVQGTNDADTVAITMPKKATADSAGTGIQTEIATGTSKDTAIYALIAVGYPGDSNSLDTSKKYYSADSIFVSSKGAAPGPGVG